MRHGEFSHAGSSCPPQHLTFATGPLFLQCAMSPGARPPAESPVGRGPHHDIEGAGGGVAGRIPGQGAERGGAHREDRPGAVAVGKVGHRCHRVGGGGVRVRDAGAVGVRGVDGDGGRAGEGGRRGVPHLHREGGGRARQRGNDVSSAHPPATPRMKASRSAPARCDFIETPRSRREEGCEAPERCPAPFSAGNRVPWKMSHGGSRERSGRSLPRRRGLPNQPSCWKV